MTEEIFKQLDEIRASGSINMADMRSVKEIAEELEMGELVEELEKIGKKDKFERGRDYAALLQALGDWVKRQPEDPNADHNAKPVPETGPPSAEPEAKDGTVQEGTSPIVGVDVASEPDENVEFVTPEDAKLDEERLEAGDPKITGGDELDKITEKDEE